jgi:hypothetical protein
MGKHRFICIFFGQNAVHIATEISLKNWNNGVVDRYITGKFRRHRFTADCIALIRFCNKVITSTLSRLIRLKGIQNLAGRFLRKENLIPLIPRHKGTGTGLTGF